MQARCHTQLLAMSWCRTILVAITAVIVGIYLARLPDVCTIISQAPAVYPDLLMFVCGVLACEPYSSPLAQLFSLILVLILLFVWLAAGGQ